MQIDPGIVPEAAEQTRQAGTAAEAADFHNAKTHDSILSA